MTLTIDLTPTEEASLAVVARQEGLPPAEAAHRLLAAHLPTITVPNQKMLAFLEAVEESHKHRPETDGSNTEQLLKEARGGAMYGSEPTE